MPSIWKAEDRSVTPLNSEQSANYCGLTLNPLSSESSSKLPF